jgi:hypothetical protein
MLAMRLRAIAIAVLLVAGCSDDPPEIRQLMYTPNAGLVGTMATINGTVAFTDSDGDISQSQLELFDPTGAGALTSPMPIMNVNQGPIGSVDFSIMFTPDQDGNWHFDVWIIDLLGRPSNKLTGTIRVSQP